MSNETESSMAVLGEWYDLTIMPPENTEVLVWRTPETLEDGWVETAIYQDGVFRSGYGYKHDEWGLTDITHWWWCPRMPGSPCYPVTSSPIPISHERI